MKDWLEEAMRMTEEAESPRQFFYWAFLSAVAGVVKNNIFLEKYYYQLYPNIYVLLVAKSGLRKGVPVKIAESLVSGVKNNRVIQGRSSIQAIIADLAEAFTWEGGGAPITKATAFVSSGELATAFVRDQDTMTILTDLYDGHYNEKWMYTLKSTGKQLLDGVNLNILGALNPTHFEDMITAKEVTGGFIARCVIVQADKRARRNSLTHAPVITMDKPFLIEHLKFISKLKGEFNWTKEAMEYYDAWYDKWNPEDYEDTTGSLNRVHDTILKVSMLIALGRRGEMYLRVSDIEEAKRECLPKARYAEEFTRTGVSDIAPLKKKFIDILLTREGYSATRTYILKNYYMDFDIESLNKVVETLETGGIITVARASENIYTLSESTAAKFNEILEALKKRNDDHSKTN